MRYSPPRNLPLIQPLCDFECIYRLRSNHNRSLETTTSVWYVLTAALPSAYFLFIKYIFTEHASVNRTPFRQASNIFIQITPKWIRYDGFLSSHIV